jgi:hypothetical protein
LIEQSTDAVATREPGRREVAIATAKINFKKPSDEKVAALQGPLCIVR